jgi:hypothetical protein
MWAIQSQRGVPRAWDQFPSRDGKDNDKEKEHPPLARLQLPAVDVGGHTTD